jgi:3-oxoacyl-ACP reductase-like protein
MLAGVYPDPSLGFQYPNTTFARENTLIISVSNRSGSAEILEVHLSGGSYVIANTARCSHTTLFYITGVFWPPACFNKGSME